MPSARRAILTFRGHDSTRHYCQKAPLAKPISSPKDVHDPVWYSKAAAPTTPDGIMPSTNKLTLAEGFTPPPDADKK